MGKKLWHEADYFTIAIHRGIEWIGGADPGSIMHSTRWHCLKCDHEWSTSFHNIKNGAECKSCILERQRIPESQYIQYADQHGFKYIGGYAGTVSVAVEWECKKGHRWKAPFAAVKNGKTRCPQCSSARKRTEDEYKILGQQRGFEYIDGYTGNVKDKVSWRCPEGHVFKSSYDKIANHKRGCPYCANNQLKSEDEYYRLAQERGFKYLGGYSGGVLRKVKWQCRHDHVWEARYDNINHGRGCPICDESRGERAIAKVLTNMGIEFEREKRFLSCKMRRPLPFDFYFQLNGIDFLCEYDGEQHFFAASNWGGNKALKSLQERDRIKTEWAAANGYKLIRVPYTIEDVASYLIEQTGEAKR